LIIGVHNKKKKKFPYQKLSTSGVGHAQQQAWGTIK
jgi:hypothetical protein